MIRSKEFALLDNEENKSRKKNPAFLEVTIIGFKSFICGLLVSIKEKRRNRKEIEREREKTMRERREDYEIEFKKTERKKRNRGMEK